MIGASALASGFLRIAGAEVFVFPFWRLSVAGYCDVIRWICGCEKHAVHFSDLLQRCNSDIFNVVNYWNNGLKRTRHGCLQQSDRASASRSLGPQS